MINIEEKFESKEAYAVWLSSLEVGSKVRYMIGIMSMKTEKRSTITSITKTGQFRLSNGALVDKNGMVKGIYEDFTSKGKTRKVRLERYIYPNE